MMFTALRGLACSVTLALLIGCLHVSFSAASAGIPIPVGFDTKRPVLVKRDKIVVTHLMTGERHEVPCVSARLGIEKYPGHEMDAVGFVSPISSSIWVGHRFTWYFDDGRKLVGVNWGPGGSHLRFRSSLVATNVLGPYTLGSIEHFIAERLEWMSLLWHVGGHTNGAAYVDIAEDRKTPLFMALGANDPPPRAQVKSWLVRDGVLELDLFRPKTVYDIRKGDVIEFYTGKAWVDLINHKLQRLEEYGLKTFPPPPADEGVRNERSR